MRILLVFLYLLLAAAWAWRLQQATEPATDTERAPQLERLTRYLLKAPPETLQAMLMSVALIPDDRLALVDAWLQRPPLQQLRELTVENVAMLKDSGSLRDVLLLGWLGQAASGSFNEAHLMITAAGDRIDDTLRLYALERLAARARSDGDAVSALAILDRASDLPTATWQTFKSYIQVARSLDKSPAALTAVTRWIARQSSAKTEVQLAEAREIQVTLLLHSDRAEDALAQQIASLKDNSASGPLPAADLDLALICARAVGQTARLLPWLERQLATCPEHTLTPQAMLERADLNPSYCHWLREYAAIVDLEQPPARAFEACVRLAATGERSALARVCALAEPAKRLTDAEVFLTQALKQPVLRPALLELTETSPLAQRVVAEALRRAPGDRELHFAATLAVVARAQPGTAANLWQSYLRLFPTDLPASRRLIQAHLSARQPQLALRVYQALDPKILTDSDRHQRDLLSQM